MEPENRIADFAKAGSDIISVHAEQSSTIHLHRVVNQVGFPLCLPFCCQHKMAARVPGSCQWSRRYIISCLTVHVISVLGICWPRFCIPKPQACQTVPSCLNGAFLSYSWGCVHDIFVYLLAGQIVCRPLQGQKSGCT